MAHHQSGISFPLFFFCGGVVTVFPHSARNVSPSISQLFIILFSPRRPSRWPFFFFFLLLSPLYPVRCVCIDDLDERDCVFARMPDRSCVWGRGFKATSASLASPQSSAGFSTLHTYYFTCTFVSIFWTVSFILVIPQTAKFPPTRWFVAGLFRLPLIRLVLSPILHAFVS